MSDPLSARDRRHAVNAVKEGLRELRTQLAALNHRVGAEASLRDADLDTFELAEVVELREVDRLESGDWIVRTRDAADRRAISVSANPAKTGDMLRLFAGMNQAMDAVCADYDDAQLATIQSFLARAAQAGRESAELLVP